MGTMETFGDELVYRDNARPHDTYVHLEGDRYWGIYTGAEVRLERPGRMRVFHHGVRLRDVLRANQMEGERALAVLATARGIQ